MNILYFAWVRERIGLEGETLDPPASVTTVCALIDWLITRGSNYEAALGERERLRAAVNQAHVGLEAPIAPGDEIALFPPVTGG